MDHTHGIQWGKDIFDVRTFKWAIERIGLETK